MGVDLPLFACSLSFPTTDKAVLEECLFSLSLISSCVLLADDFVPRIYDGIYSSVLISVNVCNAFFLFFADLVGDGVSRNAVSTTRGDTLVESSVSSKYLGVVLYPRLGDE